VFLIERQCEPRRGHQPATDGTYGFTGAWHHAPVTDQAERYDRIAEGYARWWAPVIAPSARAVLDRFDGALDARPIRLLDVGSGTGTLSLAALQRWPEAQVDAIDASREMVLATRAGAAELPEAAARLRAVTAFADALPFPDDTFDAVVSSFVLQLVPDRFRALREIRRVLRPGGRLAYVTWVSDTRRWKADDVLDDLLDELGVPEEDDDEPASAAGAGDLPSVESAATGLRRAGFRDVTAEAARLTYQFDPESYTGFIAEFDELALVESLEPDIRGRLERELPARLARLDPHDLRIDSPIAYATGRKPQRPKG
jgi:ubiquinone/menaquinone biosynthesis C-methylase UbiE